METNNLSFTRAVSGLKPTLRVTKCTEQPPCVRRLDAYVMFNTLKLISIGIYTEALGTAVGEQLLSLMPSVALSQSNSCFTASKIRDAYAFIAQNYQMGDQICLFG